MKKMICWPPRLASGIARAGAQARAADTVTLQLKWVTQAQFAGYYVAKDKGFYKDGRARRDDQAGRAGHHTRSR